MQIGNDLMSCDLCSCVLSPHKIHAYEKTLEENTYQKIITAVTFR